MKLWEPARRPLGYWLKSRYWFLVVGFWFKGGFRFLVVGFWFKGGFRFLVVGFSLKSGCWFFVVGFCLLLWLNRPACGYLATLVSIEHADFKDYFI